MIDLDWRDAAAILASAAVASGFVVWILRAKFSEDFARKADFQGLGDRIERVEQQLRLSPTHADMRSVSERIGGVEARLGTVERDVGITAAEVRGVRDGVARVEADLRLLIQHQLGGETK